MNSHNNNNIKILQWNMNGFNKKYEEITILIQDHNPDIICIQETNFKNDNISNLPNYDGYSKNRLDSIMASGGVAIYVNTNYPSSQLNLSTDIEAIVVTVKLNNNDINICNIYLPNIKSFTVADINNIIKQLP
jgi:exonuclease III